MRCSGVWTNCSKASKVNWRWANTWSIWPMSEAQMEQSRKIPNQTKQRGDWEFSFCFPKDILYLNYMIYLKGMMNILIIQYYTYNINILITSNLRQSNWTNSSPTVLLWAEALTEQTLPVWWVKLGFPSTRPLRHQPCVTACATHVLQMSLEYDPYNTLISFFNLLHRSYPHDMLHIIIIFTSIFSLAAFATSWRQVLAREFEGPLRSVGWVVRRATQHPQGTGVCQHSVHQRSLKSLTLTFCDFDLWSNFARS